MNSKFKIEFPTPSTPPATPTITTLTPPHPHDSATPPASAQSTVDTPPESPAPPHPPTLPPDTASQSPSTSVKFSHLNPGSTISRYKPNTSLWLIAPGFVKFTTPVSACSAIAIASGSRSYRIEFEFGIETTWLYCGFGIEAQEVFDSRLGVGVEASVEVGRVGFAEGWGEEVCVVWRVFGCVDACLEARRGVSWCGSAGGRGQKVGGKKGSGGLEGQGTRLDLHPVAITVQCILLFSHSSARISVPITFARIVSSLWSSHQSTLGRPVLPAQLMTCVGQISSRTLWTSIWFSMRTPVVWTSLPWEIRSFSRCPPTQPVVPPQMRKRRAGDVNRQGAACRLRHSMQGQLIQGAVT
ncbi:hypothetical protein KC349_g180 [Hortaea werneckii]|nr:hypothetical protein KC349_g180 [Hortaea werneckii]